jgi:O-antigen/teichoic acid export membrane protein
MSEPAERAPEPAQASHAADVSQLARGGALNLAGVLFAAAAGVVLYIVLGRLLGAAGSGAFLVTVAIFQILVVAGTLGADTGLIREVSRAVSLSRSKEIRPILEVGLVPVAVLGVVFGVAVWFGADTLAAAFGGGASEADIAAYLRVLAPVVPITSLYLAVLGATRGFSTMVPTAVIDRFGRAGSQPILVWIAIAAGAGAALTALAWASPYVVGLGAGLVWLEMLRRRWRRSHPDGVETLRSLKGIARDFWSFTLPRSLAAIFRIGVQWVDIVIVGALMSPRDAGIYAVSTRLLQLGLFVAASIGQVAQPMFASLLAEGHHERTSTVYQTATGWLIAITWPQYLAIGIFAPLVLSIFGPEFTEGSTVVVILAASAMIGAAAGPVDMLLLMAGKSTWSLGNTAVTLATNVVLNLILIPLLGIEGAALAWAASRIVANALPLFQVGRYLRFFPWGPGARHASVASALIFGGVGLAVRSVGGTTWGAFAVYALIACGMYLVFLRRHRTELDLPMALRSFRRPSQTSGTQPRASDDQA